MKVFTNRPIIEEKSNCCGGMSSADGTTEEADKSIKDMVKDYLSDQKTEKETARKGAVSDILDSSERKRTARRGGRSTARTTRLETKDKRVSERIENRKARSKRRTDRKAKRNAKKLLLIQKTRSDEPKFFFPLQKLRLSKKKKGEYEKTYPDGSKAEIKADDVVIDPTTGDAYDKKEIANATGTNPKDVNPNTLKEKETADVTDPTTKEKTKAIEVPDSNVSGANDGNAYLQSDVQGSNEAPQDVAEDDKNKDGEKGWSTTKKVVVGVGVVAIVGLVIYAVLKGKSAVQTKL